MAVPLLSRLKGTTYANLQACLGSRVRRKVANNTWLECFPADFDRDLSVRLRLHNTYVVTVYRNNVIELFSGGYRSKTTMARINAIVPGYVFAKRGVWYYQLSRYSPIYVFSDRMQLHYGGESVVGAERAEENGVKAIDGVLPQWLLSE